MNVVVIGGTGFIGLPVTRLLVENGHNVALVHRTQSGVPSEVRHIVGNRNGLGSIRSELAHFNPNVVLDVIPYTHRHAEDLVTTCRGVAERVVILSSADVYRNYDGLRGRSVAVPDPVPLREDAPLRETLFPYRGEALSFEWADDYEKILVERVVMSNNYLPATVLRLPAVYGPRDRQGRVREYMDRMRHERQILLSVEHAAWRWTRGFIENVAAAIALAVTDARAAGRLYNVGEAPALTEKQWVEAIATANDWHGEVVETRSDDLPENLRQPYDFRYELVTDTTRIREELEYSESTGLEAAMRQTVEWEKGRFR